MQNFDCWKFSIIRSIRSEILLLAICILINIHPDWKFILNRKHWLGLFMQIFPLNEKIENINDQYWTLRAEEVSASFSFFHDGLEKWGSQLLLLPMRLRITNSFLTSSFFFFLSSRLPAISMILTSQIPEEEKNLGPHDRLIHVYHFTKETAQNQMVINSPSYLHSESQIFHLYLTILTLSVFGSKFRTLVNHFS